MFNLTKRQLVCFGAAALVGVPLFFLLKDSVPQTLATLIMVLVMLPFFLLAMYEKLSLIHIYPMPGTPKKRPIKRRFSLLFTIQTPDRQ